MSLGPSFLVSPSPTDWVLGVCKIWHYKRKTIRLRKSAGLPQLLDPDDLPDPHYGDKFVGVLSEKEQKDLHRRMPYLLSVRL